MILLAVLSKSFSQTESTFIKIDSTNNKIDNDSCLVAECYTCNELESIARYISEIETLNERLAFKTIPLMNKKIELLIADKLALKVDKNNLKEQVSLLEKNSKTFERIEFEYLNEISSLNMDKTDLDRKRKKKNKVFGIISGVGGGVIAALIVALVVVSK